MSRSWSTRGRAKHPPSGGSGRLWRRRRLPVLGLRAWRGIGASNCERLRSRPAQDHEQDGDQYGPRVSRLQTVHRVRPWAVLLDEFFPGLSSPLGGLELEDLATRILEKTGRTADEKGRRKGPQKLHILREHKKGLGERHSMTSAQAGLLHEVTEESWQKYLELHEASKPISPRHLLELRLRKNRWPSRTCSPRRRSSDASAPARCPSERSARSHNET